jgi:hypothetical protein
MNSGASAEVAGFRPFLDSGQIKGMVPGIRGAGEYEVLIKSPGPASIANDQNSLGSFLAVFAMIGNNILWFLRKKG